MIKRLKQIHTSIIIPIIIVSVSFSRVLFYLILINMEIK